MLPSDVARLVLGYLKDEGLLRSFKEFFAESPHLEELRRHPNVEPSIPFEKGLPEILSEYSKLINAIKDRMNCNQVIASLWKMHSEVIGQLRFQYTGNAGLLHTQTHPEPRKVDQRTLTRYRMSALRKQQELQRKMASQLPSTTTTTTTATNASVSGSVSVATSPLDALTNSIMITGRQSHTPSDRRVMGSGSSTRGSAVEMEVADHRGQDLETTTIPEFRTPTKGYSVTGTQVHTPIGKSPKRKSVPPRRLPASTAASISPRSTDNVSSSQMEEEFPDLPQVLESLINNTEFQEKLAGNINKKLPVENRSEPVGEANTSAHTLSTSSTSIEELLNLQMTDDTVHEIVQSTSADPAFESLFSLFNIDREQYNRSFQENLEDAPTHHEPTVDLTTSSEATTTQLNNVPNITSQSLQSTPLSNQSHYLSDQGTGQVTYSLANQNPQVVAGSTMLTPANTGPFTSLSIQPPVTSASTGTHHQLNLNQSATVPSNDQVVTLPVFLNASGQYQIMQQAVPSTQNLVVNSPVGFQGGTLLVTTDGRVVGSPSVAIQSGQQLLPGSLAQNESSRQGSTHQQSNADPSCPVHGRRENLNAPPATGNANLPTAPTSSVMAQVNGAQNVQDQTEVVQLLATMVESDVGSLFETTPPERSFSRSNSPLTLTQNSDEIGSKQKKTCSPENSSDASRNANQNRLPDGNAVGQRAKQRAILPAPGQPNQTAEGNRNIFSSISNAAFLNPGPAGVSLVQQAGMTPSEASVPTTKSPPGVASKPRKQIQFKGLTRTLDVGWTPEVQSRTRQPLKGNSNDNAEGKSSASKTGSRGKNPDLLNKKPIPSVSSKSAVAAHNKQVPDVVVHGGPASVVVPDDMSTEVNIAAQMLVCLSNSPPSSRQSPYRQQRLRSMTSNSSPAKSPSRDWVMELRKEIGLSPNSGRLQCTELEAQTQEPQKDTKSSKRKSRTPRKQANTATETVVVTLQTEPKSKTAVQTRAAAQKAKSPKKVVEDTVAKRKSSRSTNSSKKPDGAHGDDAERGAAEKGDKTLEETGKKENRGHKRNREGNTKDETSKKPKTTKSAKKTKRSQSFPSNLDVDKFLSSLQYAE
ncbi:uncharacterized protein [Asterias amurensis]|uniref:uncharacterized protein n=1 Tax=Asterias amurensis TaxID=7602 RepID=UPI003AB8758D